MPTISSPWTATRISADAANKIQVNAGILVKNFNPLNPEEPADEDILFETTGDFSFNSQPTTHNFFEGINNAPTNVKEGLQIDEWTNTLTITALSVTSETLRLALGAADLIMDGARGRMRFKNSDFQTLTWLGDMSDPEKLFAIVLDDAVSTNGIQFTASNRGKGGMSLTFTAFATLTNLDKVPMTFYILEKVLSVQD